MGSSLPAMKVSSTGGVTATPGVGPGGPLLEHRQALAQPARHAIARHRQREHMRHLVPQRAAPVEVTALAARRAVHGDHIAEGHAQQADARQACGAHGEIIVVGIDLDGDRLRRACSHSASRRWPRSRAPAVPHRAAAPPIPTCCSCRFSGGCATCDDFELLEAVEQTQRIDGGGAERVTLIGLDQVRARLGHVAQSHQVEPQLALRRRTNPAALPRRAAARHRLRDSDGG